MSAFDLPVSQSPKAPPAPLAADLVPVPVNANLPVPYTGNPYERAITVLDSTTSRILTIAKKKGPDAPQNGFDRMVQKWDRDARSALGGIGSIGGGIIGSIVFACNATALGPVSLSFTALFTGVCATGVALWTSNKRTAGFRARLANAQLNSKDVEKMLAPYTALPPNERALAYAGVAREMKRIDRSLSPKAALMRDRLLEDPASSADPALVERTAKCADLLTDIRRDGLDHTNLGRIAELIDSAEPGERKHLAEILESKLMTGERVSVAGSVEQHRRFYDYLMLASRGEPVTPPRSSAAS